MADLDGDCVGCYGGLAKAANLGRVVAVAGGLRGWGG